MTYSTATLSFPRALAPSRVAAIAAATVAATLALAACGDEAGSAAWSGSSDTSNWWSADATSATDATSTYADTSNWTSTTTADTATGPTEPPPPPPEEEQDYDLRTPEAGDTFLYIPSAALDALIVVDARTLDVSLVEVGVAPTQVRALPGDEGAIVLNEGGSDVSIVRPRPSVGGTPSAGFDVVTLDVVAGANRLERSPDGRFAFAFYDESMGAAVGGFGSLQDVSAIRLARGSEKVMNLAVGYRPTLVDFADGGAIVLFYCDDGISGIRLDDLSGDTFLPPAPTSLDPFEKPLDREIVVTPDGAYAAVRDLHARRLTWVDLMHRTVKELSLPDYVSDLELTPDGRTLIAPMRNTQSVAVITVPDAFDWTPPPAPDPVDPGTDGNTDGHSDGTGAAADPEPAPTNPWVRITATGSPFGAAALTADGRHALLYTTIAGTAAIGMVDAADASVVTRPLVRELETVVVSPDSKMAALIHRPTGSVAAQRYAYSLLDLASGYSKIVYVEHPVTEVLFTEDANELYVLVPDPLGATHAVHRVSTRTFNVTTYPVPDTPVFAGSLPMAHKVAIALDNPTGWITFVDTQSGEVRQVNSFELNSFIE